MKAAILSIGDELVLGQTVDTNSAFLSRELAALGCDTVLHTTVGDDVPAIVRAIRAAIPLADAVVISGGLGPTADDLTRDAIAEVMNARLELRPEWATQMESIFKKLNRVMPAQNRVQAMLPVGSTMIWNPVGTACGIEVTIEAKPSTRLVSIHAMPGVPKEMKAMFTQTVAPAIAKRAAGNVVMSRTLHTFGVGESTVAEKLGDQMKRDRNPSVGTTVSAGIVSLRINTRASDRTTGEREITATMDACKAALGDLIYGEDDQTLVSVVAELLRSKHLTVATAESCTGGLLAKYLTDLPGSSDYFHQGWVTYANEAKTSALDVDPQIIAKDGAVSESVVRAMASQARTKSGADLAVAISGVAGPDGGADDKPVGTLWLALAAGEAGNRDPNVSKVTARRFVFSGDREMIRDRAAKMALTLIRFHVLGKPLPF